MQAERIGRRDADRLPGDEQQRQPRHAQRQHHEGEDRRQDLDRVGSLMIDRLARDEDQQHECRERPEHRNQHPQPRSPAADTACGRAAPAPRSTAIDEQVQRRHQREEIGFPNRLRRPCAGERSGQRIEQSARPGTRQLLQVLLACRANIRTRTAHHRNRAAPARNDRSSTSMTPAKCHFNSRFAGRLDEILIQRPRTVYREQRDRAVDHGLERGPGPERQHRRR